MTGDAKLTSIDSYRYGAVFVDGFSRYKHVYMMKTKDEAARWECARAYARVRACERVHGRVCSGLRRSELQDGMNQLLNTLVRLVLI